MTKKSDKNRSKTEGRDDKGKFVHGNKGGPGRPTNEMSFTHLIRVAGQAIDKGDKRTRYEIVVDEAWKQAMTGDKAAREWLADRTDGKPRQGLDVNIDQWPSLQGVDIE